MKTLYKIYPNIKKYLAILFLISSQLSYAAVDTLQLQSKITDVTVFFSGAQISREIKLNLNKGKHILFIDKLPQELNAESIQVKGIDGLQILAVKHQYNFQSKSLKSKQVKDLEAKIDALKLESDKIISALEVYNTEARLLLDNSVLSKEKEGSTVSTIKEAADFYRLRLTEIGQKKIELNEKSKVLKEKMKAIYTEINKVQSENSKTYSQVYISVECQQFINKSLLLNYLVNSAAWEPTYDFRVDEINKPLNLVYNAKVYQSTGEDWNNVNLTLSSNDPSLSGTKPELIKWYVGRENTYNQTNTLKGTSSISGNVTDVENGEPLPFANIVIQSGSNQIAAASADFDGNFTIKPIPVGTYDIIVSYVGYTTAKTQNVRFQANKVLYKDFSLNPGVSLAEVEVVSYQVPLVELDNMTSGSVISREEIKSMAVRGSRGYESEMYIDGVKLKKESNLLQDKDLIANSLNTNISNLEYKIEVPYTIQSDGEDNTIRIKEVDLAVDYIYQTVPKIEADAFLTAEITDWSKLNLLSGNTSIYYQGTFVAESYLEVKQTKDTLGISLGRDQNVVVKRESNKEIYDKRIFTNTIKETIGYDISIRNTKKQKVKIIVEDQYPLSDRKSIEVELLEKSGAKVEEKEGKLTWTIELAPEETKKLSYSYVVKYPN